MLDEFAIRNGAGRGTLAEMSGTLDDSALKIVASRGTLDEIL